MARYVYGNDLADEAARCANYGILTVATHLSRTDAPGTSLVHEILYAQWNSTAARTQI